MHADPRLCSKKNWQCPVPWTCEIQGAQHRMSIKHQKNNDYDNYNTCNNDNENDDDDDDDDNNNDDKNNNTAVYT